jgi:hypothetical protein
MQERHAADVLYPSAGRHVQGAAIREPPGVSLYVPTRRGEAT